MKFNLPKKRLSWSQRQAWRESKTHRKYIRRYFFKMPESFDSPYMNFGKKVGEALETGDFSGFEPQEVEVLKQVPRSDDFEREILLKIKDKDGKEVEVIGYIDSSDEPLKEILEYKTGKVWDQEDVDSHGQLDTYAAWVKDTTNKIPKVKLIAMPATKDEFGNITFGCTKPDVFNRKVTMKDIKAIKEEYLDVAREVEKYYNVYQEMLKL